MLLSRLSPNWRTSASELERLRVERMAPQHRATDDSSLQESPITRNIPQWQVNAAIVAMLGGMTGNGVATYTGNAATAKELTEMRLDIRTITTQRADADKQVVRLETKLDEALRRVAELESQQRGARNGR